MVSKRKKSEFTTATNRTIKDENPFKLSFICRITSEDKIEDIDHPFNHTFAQGGVIKVDGQNILLPNENLQYKIDNVYGPNDSLDILFDKMKDSVSKLLTGKSLMFMTTGPSSSGKTHTIQGIRESPGILPRSLEYLFNCIETRYFFGF